MFASAKIPTLELSDLERIAIDELAESAVPLGSTDTSELYVLEAQVQSALLSDSLRRELLRFRVDGDKSGAFLLRNLPVGRLPETPRNANLAIGSRTPAAFTLSLLAAVIGEQFGFLPELGGRIIQDILPVAGFENTQQSISSSALLELHCETAFTQTRADFIGLFCLRQDVDRQAATLLAPAGAVLDRLPKRTVDILRQERFATTVDASFLLGSGITGPITVKPLSVVSGSCEWPRLRCDFAETSGMDRLAQRAIDDLHEAARSTAAALYLEPGDLLFIDNHSSFHGRTSFSRKGDGRDRWLLRTFITRDLARSAYHRPQNGRVVDIDYGEVLDDENVSLT